MAHSTLLPAAWPGNVPSYPTAPVTFADAARSYLSAGGEAKYLPPLIDILGDRPVASIYPYDVRAAAEAIYPSQSAATRNRQAVTPIRAVIMHAYDRGWAPLIRVKRFREERPRKKTPASAVWLHLFCRQADQDGLPHLAALVLFMSATGARISEAIALQWPEVDLSSRTVMLLKTKTETNSKRYLPDDVAERLRSLWQYRGNDPRVFRYGVRHAVNERIKAVCDRAGIPYKSPHLCGRHTFATTAIELGMDVRTTMEAGGWSTASVFLETYVHTKGAAGRIVADRFSLARMNDF